MFVRNVFKCKINSKIIQPYKSINGLKKDTNASKDVNDELSKWTEETNTLFSIPIQEYSLEGPKKAVKKVASSQKIASVSKSIDRRNKKEKEIEENYEENFETIAQSKTINLTKSFKIEKKISPKIEDNKESYIKSKSTERGLKKDENNAKPEVIGTLVETLANKKVEKVSNQESKIDKKTISKTSTSEIIKDNIEEIKTLAEYAQLKLKYGQIIKYLNAKELAKEKKIAKDYSNYFDICDVNNHLLGTSLIKKYPIFGADKIENYKHLYDSADCELIGQSLFKIKDEFKNDKEKLKSLKPPSISTILYLSETPQQAELLKKWKIKKIEELGYSGFEKFSSQLRKRGDGFHQILAKCVKGEPYEKIQVDESYKLPWNSLKNVLKEDLRQTLLTECPIKHPNLCYNGVFDNMCFYKDDIYILEWKLGEKRKDKLQDLYDYPLQLVSYLGGFLADSRYVELRGKHDIKNVMVIHAYVDGSAPSIHCLSFHQTIYYWVQWLERIQKFWVRVKEINKQE